MNIIKSLSKSLLKSIFISIFCIGTIYAGEFAIVEFHGMNSQENALLIEADKSPDMDNLLPSKDGLSLEVRKGQTEKFKITYPTHTVNMMVRCKNNTYDRLLVGYGQHVEAFDKTYTSQGIIHSTSTLGYVWDAAPSQGNVYFTNGIDTCFSTNGEDRTDLTSMPKARSIVFLNDTCWVANTSDDHSSVQYSAYSDPTDWSTGVDPEDGRLFSVADYGDRVEDLEVLDDSVLILCNHSILKAVGYENPYQIINVDASIGCKSKGSVITYLGLTYFLGSDGQYYRTDGSLVECVSDKQFYDDIKNTAISQYESNFKTFDTENDFDSGIASHTSVTRISGSVMSSSYTFSGSTITTTTAEFNAWSTLTNFGVTDGHLWYHAWVTESSQTAISIIYDTGVSSPCIVMSTITSNSADGVGWNQFSYYARVSTSATMGDNPSWEYQGVVDEFVYLKLQSKRYIQLKFEHYQATPGVPLENYAKIYSVNIKWFKTTPKYISPEIPLVDINSWGTISISSTSYNDGLILYAYSSNTVVANSYLLTDDIWTLQSSGSIITVSTNSYIWWKASFYNGMSQIDDITINWVAGASSQEDMSALFYKDRLHIGVMQSYTSSSNDAMFVFDPELNAWWKYKSGVYPKSMYYWDNKFLVGSSTTGVVASFYDGTLDLSEPINAYYKSKFLTGTGTISPLISSLDFWTLSYDKQTSGSVLIDLYLNGSSTSHYSYTFDQTLGDPIIFKTSKFPANTNCRYFQFKIYNQNGEYFKFHWLGGVTHEFPLRINTTTQ